MLTRTTKRMAAGAVGALAARPDVRQIVFNALRLRRPEIMQLREDDAMRFLAYVFENLDSSKSQILQDLWVAYELSDMRGGFFVEFGATDGMTNSNSWRLEKQFGWSGILAEPNPVWHDALDRNRSGAVDKRCVYARSGETLGFMATEDPELSGISASAGRDHFAAVRQAGTPIEVETISLDDLLDHHAAPSVIDYMSIDTEGSELEILEAFDFGKRQVRLLSVEHSNSPQEPKIDAFLARHGFKRRFPEYSQWDEIGRAHV